MTTSTQAISAATPSTLRVLMYSSIRNGVVSPGVETTLATISLIDGNSPEVLSTVHTAYVATTSMMPAAMENRNDVFITDHGSNRDSRSRAFRVRRATPALGLPEASTSEPVVSAAIGAAVEPAARSAVDPAAGATPGAAATPGAPGAAGWVGAGTGPAVPYSGGALPPPPVGGGPAVAAGWGRRGRPW